MKSTPFTPFHIAAGARMVDFAGWNMPVEFTGITDEHMAVRTAAGLFDVSHMGEIWVRGARAFDFLQNVATNDLSLLCDGGVQYSCLTNDAGGIVDDIMVYRFGAEEYLLVVNASNTEKDWQHLLRCVASASTTTALTVCGGRTSRPGLAACASQALAVPSSATVIPAPASTFPAAGASFNFGNDLRLENASEATAQVALQGPRAMKILQKVCDFPAVDMKPFRVVRASVAGVAGAMVATTGYTGSGGCEIFVPVAGAAQLWEALLRAGEGFGMKMIGLGARDTLRLEKGYCLYGNDLDDTTSPYEAGLGWITKLIPGKELLPGRARLEREYYEGVSRRLVGFRLEERGIPRHGYTLAAPSGEAIGSVTSGTMSPMLREGIGMGYVAAGYAAPDTEIAVIVRDKPLRARVVKMPFV